MKKNIIPYARHFVDEDDIKEVAKTLKSGWLTQGPRVQEFEEALCKYAGAKYAVAYQAAQLPCTFLCWL